jgi:hypothetical protein
MSSHLRNRTLSRADAPASADRPVMTRVRDFSPDIPLVLRLGDGGVAVEGPNRSDILAALATPPSWPPPH